MSHPCSACGAANSTGTRFCRQCGKPLAIVCPACGAGEQRVRFCTACGVELRPSARPPGAPVPAAVPPARTPAASDGNRFALLTVGAIAIAATVVIALTMPPGGWHGSAGLPKEKGFPVCDFAKLGPAEFRVVEEATARIGGAAGGALALANGARVEFPAGALPEETTVSLRQLDLTRRLGGGPKDVYEVTAGETALQQPARLTFPWRHLADLGATGTPVVGQVSRGHPFERLHGRVDPQTGTIDVEVSHFSDFVIELVPESRPDRLLPRPRVGPLEVPWYPQGPTMYCFAAAAQMMLKYYGVDVEIWQIGRWFGASTDTGARTYNLFINGYAALFDEYGAEAPVAGGVRTDAMLMWCPGPELDYYLIQQLSAGRPVFAILNLGAHAVVVVGYDEAGFFLHDPSGHAMVLAGINPEPGNLAAYHFTWDQWYLACTRNQGEVPIAGTAFDLPFSIPTPVSTVVLKGEARGGSPVSGSLLTGDDPRHGATSPTSLAAVCIEEVVPRLPPVFCFTYDETQPWGYRFVDFFTPHAATPSNSDLVKRLNVTLGNGSPAPQTVHLLLYADGRLVRQKNNLPLTPWQTYAIHDLCPKDDPLKLRELPGGVLAPGVHDFLIEVRTGTLPGELSDTIEFKVTIAPAKAANVKATDIGDQLEITWDEGPEEPLDGVDLIYEIERNGRPFKSVPKATRYVDKKPEGVSAYAIRVRDHRTGLVGMPSDEVKAAVGRWHVFVPGDSTRYLNPDFPPDKEELFSMNSGLINRLRIPAEHPQLSGLEVRLEIGFISRASSMKTMRGLADSEETRQREDAASAAQYRFGAEQVGSLPVAYGVNRTQAAEDEILLEQSLGNYRCLSGFKVYKDHWFVCRMTGRAGVSGEELMPHWEAIKRGCAALYEVCDLGRTIEEIETQAAQYQDTTP